MQVHYSDTGNTTKKLPMLSSAWLAKSPELGDVVLVEHLDGTSAGIVLGPYDKYEGGGTASNYNLLENQPQIEGVTLIGDKTFEELNLLRITNTEIEEMLT